MIVGILKTLLSLFIHTGIISAVVQGCSLIQKPLQKLTLGLDVTLKDSEMVSLPQLLLQTQLQLKQWLQRQVHLLQPHPKLLMSLQVLTPMKPNPFDATERDTKQTTFNRNIST